MLSLKYAARCAAGRGRQYVLGRVLNVYKGVISDLIDQFEEETGIKVIYNTFDSTKPVFAHQTTSYDVIIPSDYAISRDIDEDMLEPLNYDHIPNMKLIDVNTGIWTSIRSKKYSVPYTWGVVGIVYNTRYVDKADIGSMVLLWKNTPTVPRCSTTRVMRSASLMYFGYSLNTTDKDELRGGG